MIDASQIVGDVSGEPLARSRVIAGMILALLVALAVSVTGESSAGAVALIWTTLAGVVVGRAGMLLRSIA